MATRIEEGKVWHEKGIFLFFKFSAETIEAFSIPKSLSVVALRAKKKSLNEQNVQGACRYCHFLSQVQFGNPSNWVRHLEKKHPNEFERYKNFQKAKKRSRSPSLFLPVHEPTQKKLKI